MDDLAAKLARYAALRRHWSAAGVTERPAWPVPYRAFPNVLVVLANPGRANLHRRLRTLLTLCGSEPELAESPVSISFCFLDELTSRGPFAPIFRRQGDDRPVDWLGRPSNPPLSRESRWGVST